jgi:hypothetical protein
MRYLRDSVGAHGTGYLLEAKYGPPAGMCVKEDLVVAAGVACPWHIYPSPTECYRSGRMYKWKSE